MNFNRAFILKKEQRKPRWVVIDAQDKILGRLATQIADVLRGKDKAFYTPHTDAGDYVVVINAQKVKLTGNKWQGKIYDRYSGWMGGYKTMTAEQMRSKKPEQLIELAVKRMLPKSKLSRAMMRKLRIFPTSEHPHQAQVLAQ